MKKKKIIYIINSLLPGGAEKGLELLIDQGLFDAYILKIVCLSKTNSALEKRLTEKVNGNIEFLTTTSVKNSKIIFYVMRFLKFILRERPNIVICSLSQSVLVARVVRFFKKFKLITFEHNITFQNKKAYYLLKITDFITDSFWNDSEATQNALLQRHPTVKTIIVPLFFTKQISFIKSNYRTNSSVKLMTVGRLAKQKNYPELFNVITSLKQKNIDVTLSIFGEGELRAELQEVVEKEYLTDNVFFMGFAENWQTNASAFDAYILMSDFEGLSIATLEAMSIGLPCIVKPTGELKNYIIDGITGLAVQNKDEAAKAVIKIIGNSELAAYIGKNGLKYVSDNHSYVSFKSKLLNASKDFESYE